MRYPWHFYIIPLLWLAWLLVWVAAAAGTKATVRREPAPSRVLRFFLALLAGILLAPHGLRAGFLSTPFYEPGLIPFWTGTFLVAAGLGFAVWARFHLGRNWSGTVTVKADHELIRTGPYAIVRHPIYTGILLAVLGTAVPLGQLRGLIALALIFLVFLYKSRFEEGWMIETFGSAYERYRAEVAALVPFVF